MARTLQPEDRIAHYRVVGPLGAGGMGEVYLAQDEKLERSVALKILPPSLVRNEERVRRFVTEAKSASSLSHPHIVAIYEIGRDRVRPGDGSGDPPAGASGADAAATGTAREAESIHYISMELVTGETLGDKIHHERTDLRTLLGYLAQAAEGLAKAHAAGIVHRDLKPSNIMISRDGYAKVLDFGLAKLTERHASDADATSAGTRPAEATSEGAVLGTVGYMSPEQVRGKSVDHRSDIFSFGCILYECATRRRPFAADSDVETMHQILNQQPDPVEALSPETPNAVRRLIGRCLRKNPEQRLQSMKDLSIELHDIVEEYDRLSPSGSSGSIPAASPAAAAAAGHHRPGLPLPAAIGLGVLAVAAVAFGLRGIRADRAGDASLSRSSVPMQMTSIAGGEGIEEAILSSDGRMLAYVSGPAGQRVLRLRQVTTGSEVVLAGPQVVYRNVSFSPDNDYVFFGMEDPDKPLYTAIYSVPSLGGVPQKRIFDVDTPLTFSPDGKQACFKRGVPQERRDDLVVADLEAGTERILASVHYPAIIGPPAWSPDGRLIATTHFVLVGGVKCELVRYDAVTGKVDHRSDMGGVILSSALLWFPDGRTFATTGMDVRRHNESQVWLVPVDGGAPRSITNDLNDYSNASLSDEGRVISAVRSSVSADLWSAPADGSGEPRQITWRAAGGDQVRNFVVAPSGAVVFVAREGEWSQLWSVQPDGAGSRRITSADAFHYAPTCVRSGAVFFCRAGADLVEQACRVDLEGGTTIQLTTAGGEPRDVSPDGQRMLYVRVDRPGEFWEMPLAGGEPHLVAAGNTRADAAYSPDGRYIRVDDWDTGERIEVIAKIVPAAGGDPTLLHVSPLEDVAWAPDSRAVTITRNVDGVGNVYRIAMDGSAPAWLTSFTRGRLTQHAWSPDGTRLLVCQQSGASPRLLVVRAADGKATEVARFPVGMVLHAAWSPDGRTILFSYGTETRDVVTLRDFR